jgi:hypothetical protein
MTALFSHTALAASGGGGGGSTSTAPVMVVDSKGAVVGQEVSSIQVAAVQNGALRKINGLWFVLQVNSTGFASTNLDLSYTTTDCSGTPYLRVDSGTLTAVAEVQNNTLYYPGAPPTETTVNSDFALNADGSGPGCTLDTFSAPMATVSTFDLTTLKLVPPFSLK